MRQRRSILNTRFWLGIAALGFWLGWTATTFGALSAHTRPDPSAMADIPASIAKRLTAAGFEPEPGSAPVVYLLPDRDCACGKGRAADLVQDDMANAVVLAEALATLDIPLHDLRVRPEDHRQSYTVAVFDARRRLRYAGPPSLSLGCVTADIASAPTILRLLHASEPTLVPALPCSC